jgi:hypothetical protein
VIFRKLFGHTIAEPPSEPSVTPEHQPPVQDAPSIWREREPCGRRRERWIVLVLELGEERVRWVCDNGVSGEESRELFESVFERLE